MHDMGREKSEIGRQQLRQRQAGQQEKFVSIQLYRPPPRKNYH